MTEFSDIFSYGPPPAPAPERCRHHVGERLFTCAPCRSERIADHEREPENMPTASFANRPRTRSGRGVVLREANVLTVSFGGKS